MFGTNPVMKQDFGDGQSLWVQEIFDTIQGEGPYTGHPAVFIRLAGCNLQCFFCDTDFTSSVWTPTIEEIVNHIHGINFNYPRSLVVLTGGEPMRQNIIPLIKKLTALMYHVQIETAGTLWVPGLEPYLDTHKVSIVCSPKAGKVHAMIEKYCFDYKYIVSEKDASPDDGLPVLSTQVQGLQAKIYRPNLLSTHIWVQPMEAYEHFTNSILMRASDRKSVTFATARDHNTTLANVRFATKIAMKYNYRLSLQTHKILGLP